MRLDYKVALPVALAFYRESFQHTHVVTRDFCVNFILAGRGSMALTWFFWLIHTNLEVENKILSQLRNILCSGNDEPNEVVFTKEELKRMVYLQSAILESLRPYPSMPIDFKQVIKDYTFPDGTIEKKGGWAFYSTYSMTKIESIRGKDCLEFKPKRSNKAGKFVSDHSQFNYAVFNAGPRLCVGKKSTYMQMKMVAAAILLRYEVNVVNGHKILPKLITTLYMKNVLLVTVKHKSASIA